MYPRPGRKERFIHCVKDMTMRSLGEREFDAKQVQAKAVTFRTNSSRNISKVRVG